MLHNFHLLTIDLSLFGEGGASGSAPAAGEGSAPAAAAEAPAAQPEVRYGKQPEQTAAPQQTQTTETPDKGKQFKDLIKGEFKDQYTEATQKLLDRRFRETDERIRAQQPIIDMLAQRYGITDGNMEKLLGAIESDTAYWQDAADAAGMSVDQYQQMKKLEAQNQRLLDAQQNQQRQYLAQLQFQQWSKEAEAMKERYPEFSLEDMLENELFRLMLHNKYPMEQAYKACVPDQLAAQAAASAEKAVADNIKARGARPTEAGAAPTPAFTVKDDVSKLSDEDVLKVLAQISNGRKVTFG